MSKHFEGEVSYALVQEDVGSTLDVRVWMARPPVAGRDGVPLSPDAAGVFSRLVPECQYRLEAQGTRKKVVALSSATRAVGSLAGSFANVQLREHDAHAAPNDKLCACQVGKVCAACQAVAG